MKFLISFCRLVMKECSKLPGDNRLFLSFYGYNNCNTFGGSKKIKIDALALMIIPYRVLITVVVFLAFVSALAFYLPSKDAEIKVFEPAKDLKFLNTEWVLSRCVTMAHWETNPDFTYDTSGIIMNKKTYHPVVVSQYALTCFDAYMKTKDEKIKTKFLNQVKYLINSRYYKEINDTTVGYPYTVNFHDLTAPWYSGLAQAEVLGVLVRYYYLTNDKSVLPLMVKIKNLVVLPVSKGGMMDTTAQGYVWIEEYPKSKQHLHVLNGFMVTVLLMDDYCRFFPGDTETRRIINDCIVSLKKSISYYDTGSWLKYDRGTSSGNVNNWYMKAQVIEADQLYRLTKDDFFKKVSLLWSTYCYNKIVGFKGCIIDSVNFSVPMVMNADSSFNIQTRYYNKLNKDLVEKLSVNRIDTNKKAAVLIDNYDNTIFKIKREKNQAEPPMIEIELTDEITCRQIAIVSQANLTDKVEFTYKVKSKNKWHDVVINNQSFKTGTTSFDIPELKLKSLRIVFPLLDAVNSMDLGEIKLNMIGSAEPSDYVHYQTGELKLTTDSMKLVFDNSATTEFAVFFKAAATSDALKKQKFDAEKCKLNTFPVITSKGNLVNFLIVAKRNNTAVPIKNIRLINLTK